MQESPITTFDGVTDLVIDGAGSVAISSCGDISINGKTLWSADEATLSATNGGKKLTILIEGGGGGGFTIANMISSVGSGGGSTSVCDGTAVTTRGSTITIRTKRGRSIVINDATGDVTIDGKASKEAGQKKVALEQRRFKLGKPHIASISVKHSASLVLTPDVLSNKLSVSVAGSGRIVLPEAAFTHLSIAVTGSGDVLANKAQTETAIISVTGSGGVAGLHIRKGGQATVTGSGQIYISKANGIDVVETLTGSGKIRIK